MPKEVKQDKFYAGIPMARENRGSMEEWLGEEPEFSENEINEILDTDVVVCGAGIAGVSAARAAAEAGAKVVVIEKSKSPNARSGQFAVIGGETLKKNWGLDNTADKADMINDLMSAAAYRADQRLLKYYADHIGEDFDWYMNAMKEPLLVQKQSRDPMPKDAKFITLMQNPVQPLYDRKSERFPCYPCTVQIRPGHIFVLRENMDRAIETGNVTTLYQTAAKKLLKDANGRVCGVIAKGYDGTVTQVNAKKGVVLATGDYVGDRRMMAYYCPWAMDSLVMPTGLDADKKPLSTGDGHKMGLWAGAKMEEEPHGTMTHNMGASMGVAPFLLLDVDGNRFMNEDCPGDMVENRIHRMKNQTAWQIFDGNWKEQIPHMPFGHSSPSQVLDMEKVQKGEEFFDLTPMDGFASEWFIGAMLEGGRTFTAPTLEGLFEEIEIPKEAALASVARYNELAEKGVDEDYGKRSDRLFSLSQPPFFAAKILPAFMLGTVSGLETDVNARVLNKDLQVIPGLYAAGNTQGNRFGCEYPTTLPGLSHAMALTFGRCAGRTAATDI